MFGSQWYIRLGNWAFNLVLLNLLWFLFSFLGLFIVGFFPATAALFAVLRQLVMDDEDAPILKLFWNKFKSEFVMSNLVGYFVFIFGLILYLDLKVLQQLDNSIFRLALASITVVVAFAYLLTLLYIFPIFVHFDLKFMQYPKHALILAVAKPFHTILLIFMLAIVLFLYLKIPALIFIFGMSLIGLVMVKIASFSFPRKSLVN
ncbi:hypothetical protein BKP37_06850 [Anaerobacillus alkalilacustris]|uniref:DUF624 domain-containing protein n=1 Tax=Anaerobacillus alkalilacustris TaxID=393763 RepID=A0A1S2LSE0_9BACI|nr:DUF624 domain-containing protein [Anaerobacillus alkalilacustris]OIJ15130.1 hypothetical protein BKP37_06850 [Anaerobacillus alkalilacustris]